MVIVDTIIVSKAIISTRSLNCYVELLDLGWVLTLRYISDWSYIISHVVNLIPQSTWIMCGYTIRYTPQDQLFIMDEVNKKWQFSIIKFILESSQGPSLLDHPIIYNVDLDLLSNIFIIHQYNTTLKRKKRCIWEVETIRVHTYFGYVDANIWCTQHHNVLK